MAKLLLSLALQSLVILYVFPLINPLFGFREVLGCVDYRIVFRISKFHIEMVVGDFYPWFGLFILYPDSRSRGIDR